MKLITPKDLIGSTVVRISLTYGLILLVIILMFGGYVYWRVSAQMWQQLDQHIASEIEALAETYQTGGLQGMLQVIDERLARVPDRRSIYLVENNQGQWLIGNITKWPVGIEEPGGWVSFKVFDKSVNKMTSARVRTFALNSGGRLLVGRDTGELLNTLKLIRQALIWGIALASITAIGGGVMFATRAWSKLSAIQEVSRKVCAGNLNVRVPESDGTTDLDDLSRSMNIMLDEINRLMAGIEQVSDNIAHDLRTPLARVRNRLSSVEEQSNEAQRYGLNRCIEEVDELIETFNAILRIARLNISDRTILKKRCDLDEVVANCFELYSPVAEQRKQCISISGRAGEIAGDPQLITQAICNVLDNAIKFSPHNSSIKIILSGNDSNAEVDISDKGCGLEPQEREQVFQRFYRGDRARQTKGNGLGLSLVKAIVDAHQAKLMLGDNLPGLSVKMIFPRRLSALSLA